MIKRVKLGEIASLKTGPFGTQFSAKEYVSSGIPVINVKNIGYGQIITDGLEYVSEDTKTRLSEHVLQTGDIVFGRKGSVDRHAYISDEYAGWVQGSDCIRLRFQTGINTRYVSHFLKLDYVKKQINHSAVGSTMASLNTDILRNLEILIPELEVQNEIENALSLLEEKIKLNSRTSTELESLAKTIYDYWFLQFEFPNEEGLPYKSSGGKMVWSEELKREIPEGWGVGTLGDYGEIVAGGTPDTQNQDFYCEKGISWITPKDLSLTDNMYISRGERDITELGLKNSSAVLMPKGSVLMSSRAPIGYLAIALNEVTTNQGFKSIVPNQNYSSEFVYYTLKKYVPALIKKSGQTTFKEVSKSTLEEFSTFIPDVHVLTMFNSIIHPIGEKRASLEDENQELAALRDWLLPMLMNGQITVE